MCEPPPDFLGCSLSRLMPWPQPGTGTVAALAAAIAIPWLPITAIVSRMAARNLVGGRLVMVRIPSCSSWAVRTRWSST